MTVLPGIGGLVGLTEQTGWQEVRPRANIGAVASYEMNNIGGFRELLFMFELLTNAAATLAVNFEVGVAGPTFRTSGYIGFGAAAFTDAISNGATSAAGNAIQTWSIHVWNADDAGEKTTARGQTFQGNTDIIRTTIARYDTAEANTCFRIRDTGSIDFGAGSYVTILGKL